MIVGGLMHASLLVSDLPRALMFYRDVLGLAPCERPELGYPGAWFALASGQHLHLLALMPPDTPETPRPPGRDRHLAFAVSDLAELERRLGRFAVPFSRSRSGRAAIFCRDPDGNALEFIASAPEGHAIAGTPRGTGV